MRDVEHRYELKFILDEAGFSKALSWMYTNTNMRKAHPSRIVNTIYFDDPGFSSVRDNLAGISIRKKTRLRWYQQKTDKQTVVSPSLEIKSRNGRLGGKERFLLPSIKEELLSLEYKDLFQNIQNHLKKSITFDDHYTPTLHVNYNREYYEDYKGVRLTFDRSITFSNPLPHLLINDSVHISYPLIIMELKFHPEQKTYVASLLRKYNKSTVRHSKYLIGLSSFGLANYI